MPQSYLFNIDGLAQPEACLMQGQVYAVLLHDDLHGWSLSFGALAAAAQAGRPTWLVTRQDPGAALDQDSPLARTARAALDDGTLRMLQAEVEPSLAADANLVGQLIAEFDHYRIEAGALVVLNSAEDYLNPAGLQGDPIGALRAWAARGGHSLLLLFHNHFSEKTDLANVLAHNASGLAGIARLRFADGAELWDILHWLGPAGYCPSQEFQVRSGADGALAGFRVGDQQPLDVAADEDTVYAVKGALPPGMAVPPGWTVVDDLEALMLLVDEAVAATVLLCFERGTNFDKLARGIFTLRKFCGRQLKIVVRETGTPMRYSQESLVMHVGANLVVPSAVGFSRVLSMLEMVQGQVFKHTLLDSYEERAGSSIPEKTHGYLAPPDFVRTVEQELEGARALELQSALIQLHLPQGLTALDALRHCNMVRAGDICSADYDSVLVYLFACREGDIDTALKHLFRLPVADLFVGEQRYLSLNTARSAMRAFSKSAANGALPDLTLELDALRTAPEPGAGRKTGTPAAAAHTRRTAPPPARRNPLPTRHGQPPAQAAAGMGGALRAVVAHFSKPG